MLVLGLSLLIQGFKVLAPFAHYCLGVDAAGLHAAAEKPRFHSKPFIRRVAFFQIFGLNRKTRKIKRAKGYYWEPRSA